MSYEEKGAWVYLVASVGTYGAYLVVILGRARDVALVDVPYVATVLWFIGIAVAASVVGRVALEIAKPSDRHKADARDKEINRFGEYVGGVVLAVGMVLPFGFALAEFDHFWIVNAMYAVFVLSAVVGTSVKLVAYRRGL
jgi:hypothetical protein